MSNLKPFENDLYICWKFDAPILNLAQQPCCLLVTQNSPTDLSSISWHTLWTEKELEKSHPS